MGKKIVTPEVVTPADCNDDRLWDPNGTPFKTVGKKIVTPQIVTPADINDDRLWDPFLSPCQNRG